MEKPLYDVMLILRVDAEDKTRVDSCRERFLAFVQEHGGEITRNTEWGQRRLAYPISKQVEGLYHNYYVEASSEFGDVLTDFIKTDNDILRGMLLRVTKAQIEEEQRKARVKAEAEAKAKAEAEQRAAAAAKAEEEAKAAAEAKAAEEAAAASAATAEASSASEEETTASESTESTEAETETAESPASADDEDSSEEKTEN